MSLFNYSDLADKIFFRIRHSEQPNIEKIFSNAGYVCLSDIYHVLDFKHRIIF